MISIEPDPTLAGLHDLLIRLPTPHTRDDMLRFVAAVLDHALGGVRLLFYLADPPLDAALLELTRCPARPLAPRVFVHDHTSSHMPLFEFKTKYHYYRPLRLAS
jgi:hypothetical protein